MYFCVLLEFSCAKARLNFKKSIIRKIPNGKDNGEF